MILPSHVLWEAFQDGHRFLTSRGTIELQCRDAGALVLPSGAIVACDPLFDLSPPPFSTRVEPDEYPVFFAMTEDNTIGLSMVLFEERPPAHWVAAKPRELHVDSGTACLMDARLARLLARANENDRFDVYWKRITDAMEANSDGWANVCLHQSSGSNMLVFKTREGDGTFCSYWGYSRENKPTCLITDFCLGELVID